MKMGNVLRGVVVIGGVAIAVPAAAQTTNNFSFSTDSGTVSGTVSGVLNGTDRSGGLIVTVSQAPVGFPGQYSFYNGGVYSASNGVITSGAISYRNTGAGNTVNLSTTRVDQTYILNRDGAFIPATSVATFSLAAAAPEPSAWALLIMGFGIAGYALRTRKRSISFGNQVARTI